MCGGEADVSFRQPALDAVGGGQSEGAAAAEDYGVHLLYPAHWVEEVGFAGAGGAAADGYAAHGAGVIAEMVAGISAGVSAGMVAGISAGVGAGIVAVIGTGVSAGMVAGIGAGVGGVIAAGIGSEGRVAEDDGASRGGGGVRPVADGDAGDIGDGAVEWDGGRHWGYWLGLLQGLFGAARRRQEFRGA